jgi:hypothetical protein
LKTYLKKFTFEQILIIEHQDRQFLALKKAWELIKNKKMSKVDNVLK